MRPFEQIVNEHGHVVMRVCRGLLGPADAEDAWSETFIAAMRAYTDLRPDSNVRGWLVTIAHRKAIDQIRRSRRTPSPTGNLPESASPETSPQTASWDEPHQPHDDGLRAALEALPPKQRGAVVYRYLADLPYAEVGVLLDSSETAARRSAADGIATLRKTYLPRPT